MILISCLKYRDEAVAESLDDVSANPLDTVADAADALWRADESREMARADRDAAIRSAVAAGVPKRQVAITADLTRQSVYDILDRA